MENKLPEEIKQQIEAKAKKAAMIVEFGEYDSGPASSARMAQTSRIDPIQKEFYINGATEWAKWFVKCRAIESELHGVRAENERLKVSNAQLKARCDKMEAAITKVIGRIEHVNDTITNDVVSILKGATQHEGINEKEGEDE
jgi:hypothetical protein